MIRDKLKQASFIILLIATPSTHADGILEWTSSDIQLTSGGGFALGSSYRNTLRIVHANGWRYGDNFMFIEFVQRDDIGMEVYGEWYPRLSLSKLSNKDLSFGVFRDFFAMGGINASSEPDGEAFKAYFLGMGTAFKLPGAGFFNLNIQARKEDQVSATGLQITPSWSIPFKIGKLNFKFDGYLDWVSSGSSGGKSYILTQPQLLLDVGEFFGHSGSIYMGVEYYYWRNKFGIDGVNDNAIQGMLKYYF